MTDLRTNEPSAQLVRLLAAKPANQITFPRLSAFLTNRQE